MRQTLSLSTVAILFLTACGGSSHDLPPSSRGALLQESSQGNLTLYVSNQSYEKPEVGIDVWLDDTKYISSTFAVGDQHNYVKYQFQVPPGEHRLTAEASGTQIAEPIIITDKHWAFVGFWYSPDSDDAPRLSMLFQDEPLYFR